MADPFRYFRVEAHELVQGLDEGVLALERGAAADSEIPRLLRLAHTLKGAARVVRQPAIAESAHAVEQVLEELREGAEREPALVALAAHLDAVRGRLAALDQGVDQPSEATGEGTAPGHERPTPDRLRRLRIEVADLDGLLLGLDETAVRLRGAQGRERALQDVQARLHALSVGVPPQLTDALESLHGKLAELHRGLRHQLEHAELELKAARERAAALRLVAVGEVFPALERTAVDVARARGRKVRVHTAGEAIRVDAVVLAEALEALLQLVQNAVVHGVEPPEERARAGKPPQGHIEVRVAHRGGLVAITCEDDGRGIDTEALRRAAVGAGKLGPDDAQALDRQALLDLSLQSGVSTAARVDEAAGRGLGLDVVAEVADRLGGAVELSSSRGEGTAVTLLLPASVASMTLLRVEAQGQVAGLPLHAVVGTVEVEALAYGEGGASLSFRGEELPYLPLGALLGQQAQGEARTAVVVQAAGGRRALGVDRLHGVTEALVRPLPALAGTVPGVLGAALDTDGEPELTLDPLELDALAPGVKLSPPRPEGDPPRPVLVVDDSLTTRMLEQSILESAGYEVHLAASGEEGLSKAREGDYSLFVVDVEMPGIDGFEFLARTRADARLGQVPAILVTSRAAPEDRERGLELGARAYIVKGAFDQERFLAVVRELVQ